jgi:hypothetical protein
MKMIQDDVSAIAFDISEIRAICDLSSSGRFVPPFKRINGHGTSLAIRNREPI